MTRGRFRTREGKGEERLPVGKCGKCGQDTYQVLEGAWLHWATLTTSCPTATADCSVPDRLGSLYNDQGGGIS